MPTPLASGGSPLPAQIWNNIGFPGNLGEATLPSTPAPSTVVERPAGVGRPLVVFLQGLILDTASPHGEAAVTNGILLEIE